MALCPIELRMNSECQKLHKDVSHRPKVSLNWFLKQQFAMNNHNIVMKTNRFPCFMTKSLKTFYWRPVFDFYRLFESVHHQRSGFWIWPLAIESQTSSTLILKGFIVKHIICWQYQRNLRLLHDLQSVRAQRNKQK